jgi:hypothetical protein
MRHQIMLSLEEDQERKAQRGISDSQSEVFTPVTTQQIAMKFCIEGRSACRKFSGEFSPLATEF